MRRDPLSEYLVQKKVSRGPAGYLDGLSAPWHGYLFLRAHGRFWRYTLVPMALHLCLVLALLAGYAYVVTAVVGSLNRVVPEGLLWGVFRFIVDAGAAICLLGVTAALIVALAVVVCGVFFRQLARRTEEVLGVEPGEMKSLAPWKEMRDAIWNLAELCLVNLGCLLLYLIPGAGAVVAPLVSFYFNAYLFGCEYFDFPLALRGLDRRGKRAFTRAHRPHALGLGTVVFLFNIVPVLGSFFLAPAVVGAVFLHRRLNMTQSGAAML